MSQVEEELFLENQRVDSSLRQFRFFKAVQLVHFALLLAALVFFAVALKLNFFGCKEGSVWLYIGLINILIMGGFRAGSLLLVLYTLHKDEPAMKEQAKRRMREGVQTRSNNLNFQQRLTFYGCLDYYYYSNSNNEGQLVAYKALLFVTVFLGSFQNLFQQVKTDCRPYALKLSILIVYLYLTYLLDFEIQALAMDYWEGKPLRAPTASRQSIARVEQKSRQFYFLLSFSLLLFIGLVVSLVFSSRHQIMQLSSFWFSCCSTAFLVPFAIWRVAINLYLYTQSQLIQQTTLRRLRAEVFRGASCFTKIFLRLGPFFYRVILFSLLAFSLAFAKHYSDCQLAYFYIILASAAVLQVLENCLLAVQVPLHEMKTATRAQECPICLQQIDEQASVVQLVCGHEFHEECGKKALLSSNRCPLCRCQF